MTLTPGSRIGAYEIVGLLGAGGMGEVYRALDMTLHRQVALKVLPESLAGDPDRLARFRREAQVLASLNHPNIANIHGFEQSPAGAAIVMELVEGPTLADHIAQGPIPPADAWPIARQLIDALEAAHDQGIIHRDLKPANIKVRDDGTVKVLDFGLAKALDPTDPSSAASLSNSPTLTARATQLGMILGTAAYMAPEQARGRAVDRRADIWAFGVVLYEMLTGRRAFDGDDVSITLAGVLKEDVKWDALPTDLPLSTRRLLRRCLEKDPKRRLAAISDARLELDDVSEPPAVVASGAAPAAVSTRERWLWASLLGAALVISAGVIWQLTSRPEVAPRPVARFGVSPVGEGSFTGSPPRFAVSPDGERLVFAALAGPTGGEQLWLRRLDSLEVAPVPGTESGPGSFAPQFPFWSPDGRYLAYFVQTDASGPAGVSRLRTVDLQGGGTRAVCELPSNNASGTWNGEGVMLVSSQETKGIQRVAATGGVPIQVTTIDTSRGEIAHRFPQFLPDGRHFIYQVQTELRNDWSIVVGAMDSTLRRVLVQSAYARFAAPNHLLFLRDTTLYSQTLDLRTFELSGEPLAIATGLASWALNGRVGFAVSDTGVLVHSADPEANPGGVTDRQLVWRDRTGGMLETVPVPTSAHRVRLSADGSLVAVLELHPRRLTPGAGTLWVVDLAREVKSPLSSGDALALSPVWVNDATRLMYSLWPDGQRMFMEERAANGATTAVVIHREEQAHVVPLDQSRDGRVVVYSRGQVGRRSLHVWSRADGTTTPYLVTEFDLPQASLSPDGRWLAYVSNESGTHEVVVQSFPDPSLGKWPVSREGGLHPRWRHDGRELFYVDGAGRLMAVPMAAEQTLVPGRPTPLFTVPLTPTGGGAYVYDVAPGGQRFLVSLPAGSGPRSVPLTVTINWMSMLENQAGRR